ncbi:hypothetical protein KKG22_01225 [Patescibacteria group bacterium]|nr:hypothetical protein [Patescibacteria group bacterium]MBU1901526.1 hypothetical protein [Patescibacteria group bacterium]
MALPPPVYPEYGWYHVGLCDLEEQRITCEWCKLRQIRYVHVLRHPDHSGKIRVGKICAGYITKNNQLAHDLHQFFFSRRGVNERIIDSPRWKKASQYVEELKTRDGYLISIYTSGGAYICTLTCIETGEKRKSQLIYMNRIDMIYAACDAITDHIMWRRWKMKFFGDKR